MTSTTIHERVFETSCVVTFMLLSFYLHVFSHHNAHDDMSSAVSNSNKKSFISHTTSLVVRIQTTKLHLIRMKLLSHLSYLSICLEYNKCITIKFFLRKHLMSLEIVVFEMSHNIQISNSVAIIKYIHNLNMSSIINHNVYLSKKINKTSIFVSKFIFL